MPKKPSRTTLNNHLDRLFSLIIRSRGRCERCGKKDETLQCAHVYSRIYKSVRWDTRNAFCLCAGCHFWAHKNPTEFTEFVKKKLGESEYKALRVCRHAVIKRSHNDLVEMRDMFKEIIREWE